MALYFGGTSVNELRAGSSPVEKLYDGASLVWSSAPVTLTHAFAIGDSTVAAYMGGDSLMSMIASAWNKVSLAVPGDTIAQQKAAWNAATDTNLAVWVVIQVGLNDLAPGESASAAIARLQDLVNTIRTDVTGAAKVLISKMIPCRERLIDLYGATNGPVAYAKWLAMNEAIAGGGGAPITGVDARIVEHEPLMNDGAGNLRAEFDLGDHIHPNNAGRLINAQAWAAAITASGTQL